MTPEAIKSKIEWLLTKMGTELAFDKAYKYQNFDSLEFVELILMVEQEFKISITDEEMADVKKMDDLVEVVESKLSA